MGAVGLSGRYRLAYLRRFHVCLGLREDRPWSAHGLNLVKWLGKKTLGLGYAVALADLVLAPFTPSNTARSGGTIFPVIKNIPPLYGSEPNSPTARKIGAYLMWTAFATTCLTSAMFLTGLAPNLLALSLVKSTAKIDITWTEWFMGMAPVGIALFLLLPLLVYKIYPPELEQSRCAALGRR